MPRGTITKIQAFVILNLVLLSTASCLDGRMGFPATPADADSSADKDARVFGPPEAIGQIASDSISESSGIAASRCAKDVIWTHNDSGDKNHIYALDLSGKLLGRWKVKGAENKDWEDMASTKDKSGKCFLYIGDIGNNGSKKNELTIYRVEEPKITNSASSALETKPADRIRFRYPEGTHDAEALVVNPSSNEIYVITKQLIGEAEVYRIPGKFPSRSTVVAQRVASISVPAIPKGLLTGADISSDGRHLVVCDYFGGYELTLPRKAKSFDEIWNTEPQKIDLGQRAQGEAVAYSQDGRSLFATSERAGSPIIRVTIK